ncbi:MAG: hypothetical protein H0W50_07320 [Parachlamydiaceae bacterium]|nr:hypothetical protein [Parachlamydiaceae bacterium]
MSSKKVAPKNEVVAQKKVKEVTGEVEEQKASLQLIKTRRIQTAEGWKRSMMLNKKKTK